MSVISRISKIPRTVFRLSYSTSAGDEKSQTSHNIEPCDILSNDEIEFEVMKIYDQKWQFKVQFYINFRLKK